MASISLIERHQERRQGLVMNTMRKTNLLFFELDAKERKKWLKALSSHELYDIYDYANAHLTLDGKGRAILKEIYKAASS